MKQLFKFVLLLTGLITSVVNADQVQMTFQHHGVERSAHLYIPSTVKANDSPALLIALHGRTSNGLRMAELTDFNLRAENYGFIAAYPDGLDRQWNYLHGISGYQAYPNDSEFLIRLVELLKERHHIDPTRIYLSGISNGGFMVQRLACYAPGLFAGFASVAASGYATMPDDCKSEPPVNMLYIHGTADEKVPWQGLGVKDSEGNQQLVTMSVLNSTKFWAARNRCGSEVISKELLPGGNSPGTHVKIFTTSECNGNAQVVLFAIVGGGHNWPGKPDFIPPRIAGRVNMDFHASEVIWQFFSGNLAQPRKNLIQ